MKIKALVIALATSVMLLGCGTAAAAESQSTAAERMTLVYSSRDGQMLIYQDMNTGVQYLVFDGYKQGGVCPLYNANGEVYAED